MLEYCLRAESMALSFYIYVVNCLLVSTVTWGLFTVAFSHYKIHCADCCDVL